MSDVRRRDVWPKELEAEYLEELERHTHQLARIVGRWPNFRKQIASEELGAAIGCADIFGADAATVLEDVRKSCGRAAELVPPKGS